MVWLVTATGSNNFVFGSTGTIALNVNLANAGTVILQPFPFLQHVALYARWSGQ